MKINPCASERLARLLEKLSQRAIDMQRLVLAAEEPSTLLQRRS